MAEFPFLGLLKKELSMTFIRMFLCSVVCLCAGCATSPEADSQVPVTLFPTRLIAMLRDAYQANDERAVATVDALRREADAVLRAPLYYVTEKQIIPPSGDRRDYMSLSPYWWPDPAKEDGLPYVRRDGERNPEVYNYPEREHTRLLGEQVRLLALLYYLTGEECYAAKAADFVRAWFLDPERGMNPNMNFAQGVPGRATGRGAGIIDARRFSYAVAVIPLIRGAHCWTEADEMALRAWSEEFLCWLETSTLGSAERDAKNNHGLWYDATRLMHLRLLGDEGRIAALISEELLPRLESQLADDGSLPKELERTLSLHYSTFALEAVAIAGTLADGVGGEVWNYRTTDGRSLEAAIDFLLPYFLQPSTWPHRQIKPFDQLRGAQLLLVAGEALGRADWLEAAHRIVEQADEPSLWIRFCLDR